MTGVGQFGQSSSQGPSILWDETPPPKLAHVSGLLGNHLAQSSRVAEEFENIEIWVWTTPNRRFVASQPSSKLAMLKRQKFIPEGRQQRVEASLAALEAPQLTDLNLEQWKQLIEEVGHEYEDDDEA